MMTRMPATVPIDVDSLESDNLSALFRDATSYVPQIRIELVCKKKGSQAIENHPAFLVGLNTLRPTIQFVESLDLGQRIEAIAHELGHLILLYRSGLRLITRKRPHAGDREAVYRYFLNLNKDWSYLLGQIGNTTHHLFLINYLKKEYGIQSEIHLCLLQYNFSNLANETTRDLESLYSKGIIAFEYERLIGRMEDVAGVSQQPELFWKAYFSAHKRFGSYGLPDIPTSSRNEENILCFLADLGYDVEDFTFFP